MDSAVFKSWGSIADRGSGVLTGDTSGTGSGSEVVTTDGVEGSAGKASASNDAHLEGHNGSAAQWLPCDGLHLV